MLNISSTPTVSLRGKLLDSKGLRLYVKRDEMNHPAVMGNKWRKLKYNLKEAAKQNKNTLVTYGGAYSNHIIATSAAAHSCNFSSIGIIRGDELDENSNPTLIQSSKNGMTLDFVSRSDFKMLKQNLAVPDSLKDIDHDSLYFLPEGGTNLLAIKGTSEILEEVDVSYDICCTAMGTGGTFLGLLKSMNGIGQLWGFSALKGKWVAEDISRSKAVYGIFHTNYLLFDDQLFGGYGKFDRELIQFILDFRQEYGILLDPIYTGKMFFRVWDMIKNDQIAKGSTLLMIHTGGLQGIEGFNFRFDQELPKP